MASERFLHASALEGKPFSERCPEPERVHRASHSSCRILRLSAAASIPSTSQLRFPLRELPGRPQSPVRQSRSGGRRLQSRATARPNWLAENHPCPTRRRISCSPSPARTPRHGRSREVGRRRWETPSKQDELRQRRRTSQNSRPGPWPRHRNGVRTLGRAGLPENSPARASFDPTSGCRTVHRSDRRSSADGDRHAHPRPGTASSIACGFRRKTREERTISAPRSRRSAAAASC